METCRHCMQTLHEWRRLVHLELMAVSMPAAQPSAPSTLLSPTGCNLNSHSTLHLMGSLKDLPVYQTAISSTHCLRQLHLCTRHRAMWAAVQRWVMSNVLGRVWRGTWAGATWWSDLTWCGKAVGVLVVWFLKNATWHLLCIPYFRCGFLLKADPLALGTCQIRGL